MVLVTDPASGGGGPLSRSLDRLRDQLAFLEEQERKRREEEERRRREEAERRRQEQAAIQQAAARRARENAERVRMESPQESGGLFGKVRDVGSAMESAGRGLGSMAVAAGRIPGKAALEVGKAGLTAIEAPWEYGITPLFGLPSISQDEQERLKERTSFSDFGRSIQQALSQSPVETYKQARSAWDEKESTLSQTERVGISAFTDPLNIVGVGATQKVGRMALGNASETSRALRVVGALLEDPKRVTFGGALGATAGTAAAEKYDLPVLPLALGGALTGGLGSSRYAFKGGGELFSADLARLQGRKGRQPALGLGTEDVSGLTEAERLAEKARQANEAEWREASLLGQPTPEGTPYRGGAYVAADDYALPITQTPLFQSAKDKLKDWLARNQDYRARKAGVAEAEADKAAARTQFAHDVNELLAQGMPLEEARRVAARRQLQDVPHDLTPDEVSVVLDWLAQRRLRNAIADQNFYSQTAPEAGIADALAGKHTLEPQEVEQLRALLYGGQQPEPFSLTRIRPNESPIPNKAEVYSPQEVNRGGVGEGQAGGRKRSLLSEKITQHRKHVRQVESAERASAKIAERKQRQARRAWEKNVRREVNEALRTESQLDARDIAGIRDRATAPLTAEETARLNAARGVESSAAVRAEIAGERYRAAATELDDIARQRPTALNKNGENRFALAAQKMRERALRADIEATEAQQRWLINAEQEELEQAFTARQREAAKANRAEQRAAAKADEADPTTEMMHRKIDQLIDDADPGLTGVTDPGLKSAVKDALHQWVNNTQVVLNNVANPSRLTTRIALFVQGDVPNLFAAQLLHQEEFLSSALRRMGVSDDFADRIATAATEAEIKRRFTTDLPPEVRKKHITAEIKKLKGTDYTAAERRSIAEQIVDAQTPLTDEGQSILDALNKTKYDASHPGHKLVDAVTELNAAAKDLSFWADINVFMQQGLKTVTQWHAILAAVVNRTLAKMHMPHMQLYDSAVNLDRRIYAQLDGVKQGGRTGGVELRKGGLVERLPGGVGPGIAAVTDAQFGTVLGGLRNLIYEGQLMMLKAAGEDITNPLVRRGAADRANASSSYWHSSQRHGRATIERNARLSAQMARAQVAEVNHWLKVVYPHARRDERIGGLVGILGAMTGIMGTAYMIDEIFGDGTMPKDPSKPGFGWVTIPSITNSNGHPLRVSVTPQMQFHRTLARTVRELATFDLEGAGEQWLRYGINGLPPISSAAGKVAGYGYEPGGATRLGDWGEGMNPLERKLSLVPMPPMVSGYFLGELESPYQAALETAGAPTYFQDDWDVFREKVLQAPWNKDGREFSQLKEWEQEQAYREFGRPQSSRYVVRQRQEETEALITQLTKQQQEDDTKLNKGEITVDQWKQYRAQRQAERSGFYEGLFALLPGYTESNPSPVDARRAVIEALQQEPGSAGRVNWDKVEEWMRTLSPEDRAYIEEYDAKHVREGTALEKRYFAAQESIAKSGYWDMEKGRTQFLRDNPNIRKLVQEWGYSDSITTYLDAEDAARDKLEAAAVLLRTNPKEWRSIYRETMSNLSAQADVLFRSDNKEKPSTGVEKWLSFIDSHKDRMGRIDWDAVDEDIRTKLTAAEKAEVDAYEGKALTPEVREYKKALKAIEESGYWEIGDRYARNIAARYGWDDVHTMSQVRDRMMAETVQQYIARGMGEYEARMRADSDVDRRLSFIERRISDARQRFRRLRRYSQVAYYLSYWDFWDPGVADTRQLVASYGRNR